MSKVFLLIGLVACLYLAVVHAEETSEKVFHHHHSCIHDEVSERVKEQWVTSPQNYFEGDDGHSQTYQKRAPALDWGDIRIYPDYHNMTLYGSKADFLKTVLMPYALQWLSWALSVHPVQGNLVLHKQCYKYYTNPYRCIQYYEPTMCVDAIIPNRHLAEAGGTGVQGADYILYVTTQPTQGNTLAYASACQFDQNNRPIAGGVNINPNSLNEADRWSYEFQYQLNVIIHEIVHALGFSSSLFPKFTDPNGQPWSQVTQTYVERGHSVTKVITPTVKLYGSKQFGCDLSQFNGVELEDQGGSGTQGSHWEKRVLNQEFMTGTSLHGDISPRSAITLALLQDSGWYQANFSTAEFLDWGYKRGCNFVYDKCLTSQPPVALYPDHWCTKADQQSCGVDRLAKGICSISKWSGNLPVYDQYFLDPTQGGDMPLTDYCPYYMAFSTDNQKNSLCIYAENQPQINYWGETYGPSARCFQSTIVDSSFTRYLVNRGSTCHTFSCSGNTLTVKVGNQQVACPFNGGVISIRGFDGTFTCPKYSEMCQ
jgi:hypothetical protein